MDLTSRCSKVPLVEKTGYAEMEKQEWRKKINETSFCH